jgi:hypothetical protein
MKTISKKQREQSDLRHFKRLLTPVLLVTFLMAAVLMVATPGQANDAKSDLLPRQQSAQETGGYWQRVEKPIVDPVSEERITVEILGSPDKKHAYAEEVRYGVLCGTATNTLSDGSFVYQRKYFKRVHCYKHDHYFTAVATWSQPPERITPGKPLTLQADLSKATSITSSTSSWYAEGTQLSISTDEPDVGCGYSTGGKDVCSMRVSAPTPEGHVETKEDCVLEVGAGSSEGDQFALRYCTHAGGYRYIYEWVADEEKPADPGPAEVEDPKPEQPKPDPPKADDSEPDTGYQGPSSSDSGSDGSILGPLAVLGTLGTLGTLGVLGVVGGVGAAAAAILVAVLKGGAAATAAGPAVGTVPEVETDSVDDLLDELLDELDREIEAPEETDEAPEPEAKKKRRDAEDEAPPEIEDLDEVEEPEVEEEMDDPGEEPKAETEEADEVEEPEAEAEMEDPGEEPEAETEEADEAGESEAEEEIDQAADLESEDTAEPPQKKPVERKETEATIGEPSGDVDWTKYEIDHIRSKLRVELEAMKDEGRFIGNKTGFRKIWNMFPGQITNRIRGWNKNSYCGEMVEIGKSHLKKILPDAYISDIIIERNGQMNHIANRVILQDGTEIIVDYWESLATGKPAIYTPEAWLKKWEKELGKPLWGDWLRRDLIDNAQNNVVRHVIKHGEGGIENFQKGKTSEPLRNWWKNLDPEKKKTLIDQEFKKFSPRQQRRMKFPNNSRFRKNPYQ